MWFLRPVSNPPLDVARLYEGSETLFSIKLIHGGEFSGYRDRMYKNGKVRFVDKVDIDKFSMLDMDFIMKGLGYKAPPVIYYHFRLPGGDFYFGLRALGNDDDLRNLRQYVKEHKVIRVYTEHGATKLLTYFMNPKPVRKVLIKDLSEEDEVKSPLYEEKVKSPTLATMSNVNPKKELDTATRKPLTLTVSPEKSRNISWNKVICAISCSKQLFADEDDEAGPLREVEVQRNRGDIVDMTVDEEHGFNLNWGEDVHMNGDSDDNNSSEEESNISMQISDSSDPGVDFLDLHNSEPDDIEEDNNSVCEVDLLIHMDQNNDNDDNGAAEVQIHMDDGENVDFDLHLYQHIMQTDVEIGMNVAHERVDTMDGTVRDDDCHAMADDYHAMDDDYHAMPDDYPAMDDDYPAMPDDYHVSNDADTDVVEDTTDFNIADNEEEEYEEGSDADTSEGSDYWVDEDNLIPDVEVDMRDFNIHIDQDAEYYQKIDRVIDSNDGEEEEEEAEPIDNEAWDSLGEDSDGERKRRSLLKEISKDTVCSQGEIHKVLFRIGQKYSSKKHLKERVHMHALETRRSLYFKKNDKIRMRVVCTGVVPNYNEGPSEVVGPTPGVNDNDVQKGKETDKGKAKGKKSKVDKVEVRCSWVLQVSRRSEDADWFVKTYNPNHTCLPTRKIRSATAKFLSKQIMDQVELNPNIPIRALQEQLQKKYNVGFSIHKIFRAKAAAMKHVIGDWTKQYALLRDYILELQETNPGTTVKLDFHPDTTVETNERKFRRIYVCLGALKRGYRAGMRDFLGFDGCFMKGPFPGQILTAVGVDSNNGIYPLAWAIVESENTASWKWFLQCLMDDLDLDCRCNYTFITDRQKGLLPAIASMFPSAEHRYCLRHIYENMRKTWRTREYKDYLWKCAIASTVQEFTRNMKELHDFDPTAFEWLRKIPPQHWARSHFSGRAVSDMLLNNLCEIFNSKLIDGRDKPIITCLDFIREYCMKRICNVVKLQSKCMGPLTPNATKIMQHNVEMASQYTVRWGGNKYQVRGPWEDQHVVDLVQNCCTCRKWELTGIPCKHVIAALNDRADHAEPVGELYTYVHKVHWLKTWKEAYHYKVEPIKGRSMWPLSTCPVKINPPQHHAQPGRPKKKRRQTAEERIDQLAKKNVACGSQSGTSGAGNLTRKFITVRCSKCGNKGHNARTCKGQGASGGGGGGGGAGSASGCQTVNAGEGGASGSQGVNAGGGGASGSAAVNSGGCNAGASGSQATGATTSGNAKAKGKRGKGAASKPGNAGRAKARKTGGGQAGK